MPSMTLSNYTCKDLAQMAKKRGVRGWHSMRKAQLVRALLEATKSKTGNSPRTQTHSRKTSTGLSGTDPGPAPRRHRAGNRRTRRNLDQLQSKLKQIKSLASQPTSGGDQSPPSDRLVVMVRDPYWLHAYWELSNHSVQRAQAAMGQHWHTAKPVLRLLTIDDNNTTTMLRNIDIHGRVNNWYVDVQDPPSGYRLEIGYLAADGQFHCLSRSNAVTTPPVGIREAIDNNWLDIAENADRIYAMSGGYSSQGSSLELQELLEERLHRPMGSPMRTRYGAGSSLSPGNVFDLAVDAEVVIYGATRPDSHVTLKEEPVQLKPDGTFAVRIHLPNCRQVIPVVASSGDGSEQRTASIAVERNTKMMEPVLRNTKG